MPHYPLGSWQHFQPGLYCDCNASNWSSWSNWSNFLWRPCSKVILQRWLGCRGRLQWRCRHFGKCCLLGKWHRVWTEKVVGHFQPDAKGSTTSSLRWTATTGQLWMALVATGCWCCCHTAAGKQYMLVLRLGVFVDSFDLLCLGADLGECQDSTCLTGWKSFPVNPATRMWNMTRHDMAWHYTTLNCISLIDTCISLISLATNLQSSWCLWGQDYPWRSWSRMKLQTLGASFCWTSFSHSPCQQKLSQLRIASNRQYL